MHHWIEFCCHLRNYHGKIHLLQISPNQPCLKISFNLHNFQSTISNAGQESVSLSSRAHCAARAGCVMPAGRPAGRPARPRPTALLPPRSNGKPEAATVVVVAPDDEREDDRNMLSCTCTSSNKLEKLLHLVGWFIWIETSNISVFLPLSFFSFAFRPKYFP
jgi:hypothetical protein